MSRLTDLLRQVRQTDTQLARDLEAEISELTNRRTFGLVFEAHQPEAVELPGRSIRRGDKVRLLAPRGEIKAKDDRLWRVQRVERVDGQRVAHLSELDSQQPETQMASTDDLIVVAEFSDRIYPGLVETGRVERDPDKPFHTVVNAENYHALEMLTYTHRHSIDAIYIDPPYNTGAEDWKYNNNYVEADDDYRHSKWLAFMERRLKITRELLNPEDSVLIVTIDEKEYLRLGLLLEQTFPEARITMVTSAITAAATRAKTFGRSAEYIYFVQFGESAPVALELGPEWNTAKTKNKLDLYWSRLIRTGTGTARTDSPNLFYPIFISDSPKGPIFRRVGEPFYGKDRNEVTAEDGIKVVWPIRRDGSEGRWQVSPPVLRELIDNGFAKIGPWKDETTTIYYLKRGERAKVESGEFPVIGNRSDGSVITDGSQYRPRFIPTEVWRLTSHDAGNSGSRLLAKFIPRRKFPFPKSLYAVEDALRFFVEKKPAAKILDFFAGSGTTAHAVMRLNRRDNGRRQCISVTNNEVSAQEQRKLRKAGLRPGDPEWEALGICDHVTKPRVTAAITGKTPEGEPIKGDYNFTDEFPMADGFEENAAFFTLTYETPLSVRHHRAFERIAPMLWLKAGSRGRMICDLGTQGWDVAEAYAVLENFDRADEFMAELQARSDALLVYLITDDDAAFQMACRELSAHHTPVRLYESYLHNFQLNLEGTV